MGRLHAPPPLRATGTARSAAKSESTWISLRPAGRHTERGHRGQMEIVIAAAVLAAGLVIAALLLVRRAPGLAPAAAAPARTGSVRADTTKERPAAAGRGDDAGARHQEMGRQEERLRTREGVLDTRVGELDAREAVL